MSSGPCRRRAVEARRDRALIRLALALCVTAAGASSVHADIVTAFTPSAVNVCQDTVTVDLVVDAAAVDLRGFSLVLEFNPLHIVPVSVQAGPLVTGAACASFFAWVNIASVGDSILVDGATLGCSMSGPGAIVRMRFAHGPTQGTSPLRCRRGTLRNSLNQSLPYTCPDGSVTYLCPVAVDPRTWGRIKRLFE